jgi:hypothetical protein
MNPSRYCSNAKLAMDGRTVSSFQAASFGGHYALTHFLAEEMMHGSRRSSAAQEAIAHSPAAAAPQC